MISLIDYIQLVCDQLATDKFKLSDDEHQFISRYYNLGKTWKQCAKELDKQRRGVSTNLGA